MAKTPNLLNRSKLDNLRSSQKMWGDIKSVFADKIFSIRVLQNFYNAWKASGYTSTGYQNAMHLVERPDNPATREDESITEKMVQHWAEDYFKKPWSEIYPSEGAEQLNKENESHISELSNRLREFVGNQLDAGHQIDDLDDEIQDVEMIMKSDKS